MVGPLHLHCSWLDMLQTMIAHGDWRINSPISRLGMSCPSSHLFSSSCALQICYGARRSLKVAENPTCAMSSQGDDNCLFWHLNVRYFRTPCDHDPQQEISKNFKFFKNSLKILNVYFWGKSVYFWGKNAYFWGNNVYFGEIRDSRRFLGFWDFLFFVARGVWGLCGSGGP